MFRCQGWLTKMLKKCRRSYSLFSCDSSVRVKPLTISTLSNGMKVATEESDSPLACVALFIETGPVYEKPTNHGITHFIEHMAYRGFESMSKRHLEDHLADIGAKMSVSTTREFQMFSGQCCVENISDIVRLLFKIVTELELTDSEIKMAKQMIDMESIELDKNVKAVVSDYLHEIAFQCTPLGRRIMGHSRTIKKINRYAINCYMKENYYPGRFVLVTSGAVSHSNMVSNAEECFGKLKEKCVEKYCPPQRFTGSQITYRDDSLPFVYAAIAVEAPGMRSKDYLTMLLASHIIGSWNKSQGGSDRHGFALARAAATSSLCDCFESFYIPYRDVGLWGIYMVSEKMDAEDMLISLQNRWMHLCISTLSHDVERGIKATKLELAKRVEGSVKSCYDIGMQILYNGETTSLAQMYERLAKLSANKIKKVTRTYLYDRCPAIAAIGPTEALPEYTRIRAGMYWLRL